VAARAKRIAQPGKAAQKILPFVARVAQNVPEFRQMASRLKAAELQTLIQRLGMKRNYLIASIVFAMNATLAARFTK